MEHGFKYWMLTNSFHYVSMSFLNKESKIIFLENKPRDAFALLNGMIVETNIIKSLN
jgi:hypothetical protein